MPTKAPGGSRGTRRCDHFRRRRYAQVMAARPMRVVAAGIGAVVQPAGGELKATVGVGESAGDGTAGRIKDHLHSRHRLAAIRDPAGNAAHFRVSAASGNHKPEQHGQAGETEISQTPRRADGEERRQHHVPHFPICPLPHLFERCPLSGIRPGPRWPRVPTCRSVRAQLRCGHRVSACARVGPPCR
jgi:hypothetical protein